MSNAANPNNWGSCLSLAQQLRGKSLDIPATDGEKLASYRLWLVNNPNASPEAIAQCSDQIKKLEKRLGLS